MIQVLLVGVVVDVDVAGGVVVVVVVVDVVAAVVAAVVVGVVEFLPPVGGVGHQCT